MNTTQFDTMSEMFKPMEAFKSQFGELATARKENADKMAEFYKKSFEVMSKLSKDNVDAMLKSSSVMAEGMYELSQEVFNFSQTQLDDNVDAAEKLGECKTFRDAADLQTKIAKENYERAATEMKKVQELSQKIAKDAYAPIQEAMKENAEVLKTNSAVLAPAAE